MPNEPQRNLGVRVRASVEERLDDLLYQLRKAGIRSSKAEVVEALIWNLPAKPDDEFRTLLAEFRRQAPREAAV